MSIAETCTAPGPRPLFASATLMNPKSWPQWTWLLWALLLVWMLRGGWEQAATVEAVPYSQFEQYLRDGKLANVQIGDRSVTGTLRSPADGKSRVVATLVEPAIAERLSRYDVPYSRVHDSNWLGDVLSWFMPALVFFGLWYFMNRRLAGKSGAGTLLGIGQSKAKVYMEKSTGVRFDDVAGVDEAKAELQEIVEFLKDPKKHGRLGARVGQSSRTGEDHRRPHGEGIARALRPGHGEEEVQRE